MGGSQSSRRPASRSSAQQKPGAAHTHQARAQSVANKASAPKAVDSVSQASWVAGGSIDDFFGSLKPKAKPTGLAATLPALIPGDDATDGGGDPRLVVLKGNALTLDYKVMVSAPQTARGELQRILDGVFEEIDRVFNNWNPASEISRLNGAPAGSPVQLSQPLAQLLFLCRDLNRMTEGRFDPTVGPLRKTWIEKLRQGAKPTVDEARAAAALVGMSKVSISPEGVVTKSAQGVTFDLCAISKGLAVDMLVERLAAAGFLDCYVDWAGDIRAAGRHPAGRDWRTAVACPPELANIFESWKSGPQGWSDRRMLADLPLQGSAAATSGDYFQIFKFGYFHIFDPRRGAAMRATAKSLASATVVAGSCALADALATAVMTCESDAAAKALLDSVRAQMPGRVHGYVLYSRSSTAVLQSLEAPAPSQSAASPASPPRLGPAAPAPAPVSGDQLRDLMRCIPLPVAVVAAPPSQAAGGIPFGITANSLAAASTDPPLVSFNVMRGSVMHAVLTEQRGAPLPLAVHLLGAGQADIASRFTGPNQAGLRTQFDGLDCQTDPATGIPSIQGCFAVLRCAVEQVIASGDHALVTARVLSAERRPAGPNAASAFPAVWYNRACRAPAPLLNAPNSAPAPAIAPLPNGVVPFAEVAARLPRPAAEIHVPSGKEFVDGFTLLSVDPPLFSFSLRAARPAAAACSEPGAEHWLRLSTQTGPLADVLVRTLAAHPAGDSRLVIAEPRSMKTEGAGAGAFPPAAPALLFFDSGARRDAPPAYCALP